MGLAEIIVTIFVIICLVLNAVILYRRNKAWKKDTVQKLKGTEVINNIRSWSKI